MNPNMAATMTLSSFDKHTVDYKYFLTFLRDGKASETRERARSCENTRRGKQLSRLLACFACLTIPTKNKELLVVCVHRRYSLRERIKGL